ncbi:MAG TPA: type II toxin-antitoxin system HicB family antitoxin [Rhodanobacteraceae bacterium]|nr:type II toxin-antitoxin system HicB family antitoxin [Rhodanobacteraceae bacterium]
MLIYPATLKPDGDGYLVKFPDIPEALTQGTTREEALGMAADALRTAMDFYFEDGRRVPMPSRVKRGQVAVELPPSVGAKVLLLNTMLEQGVTAAELARRLHTSPQSVNRLVNLAHATKIDTVATALKALGRRMELVVR